MNFHFSSMACQYPSFFTPIGRLLLVLAVPIIGVIIVWGYFCIFYLWDIIRRKRNREETRPILERGVTKLQRLKWECRQTTIVILNMIYFPIVKQIIAMIIPCKEDSGVSYLPNVPWVDCMSSNTTYISLRVIAGVGIALYVIGIPFGIFGPLLTKYSKLCKELEKTDNDPPLQLREKQAVMDMWLGSIYLPYREAVRSKFEIFALLRKFMIACTISFIPRQFSVTMMVLIVILFGCFVVHMLLKPYIDSYDCFPVENFCEGLVLGVLLHSFVLIPFAEMADGIEKDNVLWLIIAINTVTIVILIGSVIVIFRKKQPVNGIAAEMMSQSTNVSHN